MIRRIETAHMRLGDVARAIAAARAGVWLPAYAPFPFHHTCVRLHTTDVM